MLNRHFSIYLIAYILPAAVGFFAVTAYSRLLTPAEYGVYVVGISLAGILGAIFFAWIKLSVSRYQAMSAEVDFRGTAMVAFALTVAVLCATTPLVFLFRSDLSVGLLLASMFVAIMANAVDVGQEFERAKLRPYRFAAISIVRSVSSVGFGGDDLCDLYITTADNSEDPSRAGTLFRARVEVPGLPRALANV